MKVAILISGHPIFNSTFSRIYNVLKNYDQIDWFFLLWNTTSADDRRIPADWPTDTDQLRTRLLSMLPDNSNIAGLSVVAPPTDFNSTINYKLTMSPPPKELWTMFTGMKQINTIRQQYEVANGSYDLVAYAKGNISLKGEVDFTAIHQQLGNNVFAPMTYKHNPMPGGTEINTGFVIGSATVMDTYFNLIDSWDSYNQTSLLCQEHALVGHHLDLNNITAADTSFDETEFVNFSFNNVHIARPSKSV